MTPSCGEGETSALTSTRHGSEDPALAILDWLAAKVLPPLENIHAPDPGHRAHPIFIMVVPPPCQHPAVLVVTIYLWHDKRRLVREEKCLSPAHMCCHTREPSWSRPRAHRDAQVRVGGWRSRNWDALNGEGFWKHVLLPGSLGMIITCSSHKEQRLLLG